VRTRGAQLAKNLRTAAAGTLPMQRGSGLLTQASHL
jgi:hypothetical protein